MSGQSAPHRLIEELDVNPRLVQPLCLYAAITYDAKQKDHLLRRSHRLQQEFNSYDFLLQSGETLEQSLASLPELNNGYRKLWQSYVSVRDRKYADNHTKTLIHRRVRALQEQKKISNYRIYTDLRLNSGNMNAWLTHQDCSKVSLDTARKTLQYLQRI